MKIWKFYCDPSSSTVNILMPKDAKILSVQEQQGHICFWALFNSEHESEVRQFAIIPTGSPFDCPTNNFLGTVQLGWTVWHIFEITK